MTEPAPIAVDAASSRPVAQSPALGILLRVLAMALMAMLAAIVKACAERGVPVLEIIFFRNAFAFIPVMLYIWRTSGFGVLRTRRPGAHLTRSAVGLTGMICGFTAVSLLPLTQSTAISFSAPLFMVALSALILKEPVGLHRWAAVAVGFVGVLIMVHPDPRHFVGVGVLFAIAAAVGSAGAMIAIREISRTEPGPTIVFYFTLAGTAVGLASLPFGWVMPSPGVLALLVAAGLIGGTGQLLLTEAIRRAPVAVVAPFDYTQLVWAGLIGFLVWGETPAILTLIGAMVVAASSTYILWREIGRSRI
ncbi:DMT family transporter [Phenylobacterium sp.]|uniref:DMT family transporter n=1 Tax=Phenylobacterium sp. TaxID=1871053 RepID=UPI0025D7202C|nr:DMT family transporter [Phenylobacterium sp.]